VIPRLWTSGTPHIHYSVASITATASNSAAARHKTRRFAVIYAVYPESCANISNAFFNQNAKTSTLFAKQQMLFDFGHPKFSSVAEEIQFESFATRVSC
jgi:hypothetical protein